jgi:osmotically inducible lipoprotein OsmB
MIHPVLLIAYFRRAPLSKPAAVSETHATHDQPWKVTQMKRMMLLAAVGAFALAACGTTPGDRAVSGGLIGAGAGAAIGSLSGNAGAGAVIGGVAGAAAGAVSDPCSVNLGDPVWKNRNASREDYYQRCGRYPG